MKIHLKAPVLGAAAAIFASLLAVPASAQEKVEGPKVEWKISVWGNPRAFTKGFEYIAEQIKARTNGNFTFTIGFNNQFSPEKENLDGLKIEAFEGAAICTSYHPGRNPASMALDLPFLPLANFDIAKQVYETYYQHPAVQSELGKWNAMAFMAGILPQYEFMGVGDPPKTVAAWKGLRVRALGGLGEAMRVIGANTLSPPASEVYTALERATVDAASFPFSYAHASYKLQEISKWYTTNLSPGTINCPYVFAITAWKKLPPQYQKLLMELKEPAYAAMKAAYKDADDKNIPDFNKRGLIAITYPPEELQKFRDLAGKPVWDAWVKEADGKGLPGKELLQLILDTAKKAGAS
jgi:TRAP-type mannitol/chloroaromatic compound transport system substrate-binding protein